MPPELTAKTYTELLNKILHHITTAFVILFAYLTINIGMVIPSLYEHVFGKFDLYHLAPIIYYLTSAIFVFLITPVLFGKLLLSNTLKDMGFVIPTCNCTNIFLFTLACALLSPFLYVFFHSTSLQAFYRFPHMSTATFVAINVIALPIYYFAEEFFFRGFLFLTLWERIGWHSFWITDALFTYGHLSKPMPELIFCIPATVILNFLVSKSKSFYPPFIAHVMMGLTLNIASWYM